VDVVVQCTVPLFAPFVEISTGRSLGDDPGEMAEETEASPAARQWRRLSPSGKLMVDPERGARCAIRDTGAAGADRYDNKRMKLPNHWT